VDIPKPARTLEEIAAQVIVEPLKLGDPRYVDLSSGRSTTDLGMLRIHLQDHDAAQNRFAKVVFTGHRGSGKSTELLRLEHELSQRFTPLHLCVDDTLLRDCDYPDLLLWLVDSLARTFDEGKMPLDERLTNDVAMWFAETTKVDVKKVQSEVSVETEAEAQARTGLYWLSLKILARLKASIVGSVERRQEVRRSLKNYSDQLIDRVNLLLDNAQRVLESHGKTPDLLIVQDNLDRLPPDAGQSLFIQNGDLLKRLRAHFIFTVPIAMVLAPWNIGSVFEHSFTMPMVKVQERQGQEFKDGIDALVKLLKARVDVKAVFSSPGVARYLARMSGGSARDLIRLLSYAQLTARALGKQCIDQAAAEQATGKMRIDYERLLIPGNIYFPLLAQVHRTKSDWLSDESRKDPETVQAARDFFSQLLVNGSVLEYNGDSSWYDVHPVVQEIQAFKDALAKLEI